MKYDKLISFHIILQRKRLQLLLFQVHCELTPYFMKYLPEKKRRKLKVQSCKLYNNKYTIAPTQMANTDIFAFIAILVFQLLSRKVLFIHRKDNRNCLFKNIANLTDKLLQNYK